MLKNKGLSPFFSLLQIATRPVDGVAVTVSDLQMLRNKNG
jgi:hypothetical protein